MSDLPVALDHCVIHVSDWDVAKDFYTRVMGAEAVSVQDGYVFRWGDKQLNCHGPNKFAEPKARMRPQHFWIKAFLPPRHCRCLKILICSREDFFHLLLVERQA